MLRHIVSIGFTTDEVVSRKVLEEVLGNMSDQVELLTEEYAIEYQDLESDISTKDLEENE